MNKKTMIIIWAIAVTLAAILAFIITPSLLRPPSLDPLPPPDPGAVYLFVSLKTILSFVNIILVIPLIMMYLSLYRKYRSDFTLALLILMAVLLCFAITSNPLIHRLFGYREEGLGPFTIIPDIFTTIGLLALAYVSLK